MRYFKAALAIALASLCQPSFAETGDQRATLEKLMREWRLHDASAVLDQLIDARLPKDGTPRADPELNGVIGRFVLQRGSADSALSFLQASHKPGRTADDEAQLLTAEGQANLISGNPVTALAFFDRARALQATPSIRASATRARIEALLATDPAGARSAIGEAAAERAADTAHDWEWSLFEAQALMLTGQALEAQRAAGLAWSAASHAPYAAAAPARAGAMLAAIAGLRGDKQNAIALLAAAAGGAANDGEIIPKVVDRLPVCGANVGPADAMMIALFRDDEANAIRIAPLWASRPQIVAAFLDGMDGEQLADPRKLGNAAVVLTIRCRTTPSAKAPARHSSADPLTSWAATRGLLPRFSTMGEPGEQLTATSLLVDQLTSRYGAESPLLIGPLFRLEDLTVKRFTAQRDVQPGSITDLNDRLIALVGKVGGTESFIALASTPPALTGKLAAATSRQQFQSILADGYIAFLGSVGFDTAYTTFRINNGAVLLAPEQRAALLQSLVTRAKASGTGGDPRLVALELDQISAARDRGDVAAFTRLVRDTHLPPDLCVLRPEMPRATGNAISADDFPPEGNLVKLAGRSALEFDLDATGQHKGARILATMPPFLFDDVIAAKAATISFSPAKSDGKPVSCRGLPQMIRWQLPEGDDDGGPITPQAWEPGV